jgi:hypothetical protein
MSDVPSLVSCPALHTLYLAGARVGDVSALASCQALHTLYLDKFRVRDVSAATSCGDRGKGAESLGTFEAGHQNLCVAY